MVVSEINEIHNEYLCFGRLFPVDFLVNSLFYPEDGGDVFSQTHVDSAQLSHSMTPLIIVAISTLSCTEDIIQL